MNFIFAMAMGIIGGLITAAIVAPFAGEGLALFGGFLGGYLIAQSVRKGEGGCGCTDCKCKGKS